MDYHLERGMRLHTEVEHKNLYSWAINEIDTKGQKVGGDYIPWGWTLRFTATSCVLSDNIKIRSEEAPEQRQAIRLKLRPGTARDDENYHRRTTFSMFGTDRTIKDFQLDIHPITKPTQQESCSAWGTVSYTTEIDFRNETSEDSVVFYLFVTPETFGRYAAKVAYGLVDDIVFSVGSVDGFYSEWSPSISTRDVKVLTAGEEHAASMTRAQQIDLPRLGHIGSAELYIGRNLEFGKRLTDPDALVNTGNSEPAPVVAETIAGAANSDPQLPRLGMSLRRAVWVVVGLLSLILVAIVLKQ